MTHTPASPMRTFAYPSLPPPLFVSRSNSSLQADDSEPRLPFFATPSAESKPALWTRLTRGWRYIVFHSWLNILIFLIPIAYVLSETMENPAVWVFTFSLLGLIPLMQLHELTTEELNARLGGANSGLINASMANVVEIIVAATALRKCELRVVQSTLIGSMLSRILLVLGICLFAGGIRFSEQVFEKTANSMNMSLLSISVGAILLPAAFHFSLSLNEENVISESQKRSILQMSHSVSIVLLFIYIASLVFQLWSHNHLYQDTHFVNRKHPKAVRNSPWFWLRRRGEEVPRISPSPSKEHDGFQDVSLKDTYAFTSPHAGYNSSTLLAASRSDPDSVTNGAPGPYSIRLVDGGNTHGQATNMTRGSSSRNFSGSTFHGSPDPADQDEMSKMKCVVEEHEHYAPPPAPVLKESRISLFLVLLLLAAVTVGVGFSADWLVESMNEVSTTISKEWVGLILLPAVGSLAECATAINISYKDKLSFSISVAVGSTIQTALFVTPFMVIVAWIADKPLALLFDPFESLVLYISVQVMNHVVSDGRSNWLEGLILICLYIVIGVSFWFYPGSSISSSLAACHPTPIGAVL